MHMGAGIVGTVLGDAIAQVSAAHMERKQHVAGTSRPDFVYDWARTCRLCLYSALIGTPVGHWWFGFLDKVRPVGQAV